MCEAGSPNTYLFVKLPGGSAGPKLSSSDIFYLFSLLVFLNHFNAFNKNRPSLYIRQHSFDTSSLISPNYYISSNQFYSNLTIILDRINVCMYGFVNEDSNISFYIDIVTHVNAIQFVFFVNTSKSKKMPKNKGGGGGGSKGAKGGGGDDSSKKQAKGGNSVKVTDSLL